MFSGKSLLLLERIEEARAAGRSVAVFKHASDRRYEVDRLVAHNGQAIDAIPAASAAQIRSQAANADVVVIDEAQFFDTDLIHVCRDLAAEGRSVIVAGLDRDSWGLPFGPVPALADLADHVVRTRAICARCGKPADFTQRITPIEGKSMVGGRESYEARCAQCFASPPIALRQ